jgi:predicted patatin/cPLA2 family phospholipase
MAIRNNRPAPIFLFTVFILTAVLLSGCATFKARHTVPADRIYDATISGMPDVRVVMDYKNANASIIKLERIGTRGEAVTRPAPKEITLLALSGGGASGAFGAGFMCGWTAKGSRPDFDIVTGVSTGALMGPAVFLGPKYDDSVKKLYTTHSDKDIATMKDPVSIFIGGSASMMSTKPLAKILDAYMTMDMMNEIAREHAKGRRFYVATSQIDAQRMVIWDMGAIASIGTPRALDLFHKVLLASSAIPVAFPPVMFDVESDGKNYNEMHVDGGVTTQTFGNSILTKRLKDNPSVKGIAYIVYNEKIVNDPGTVKADIEAIAKNSMDMIISSQGIGDIFRMYEMSRKDGFDFNLAYIPADFAVSKKGEFDPVYMNKLFDMAYGMAKAGYPWGKQPPVMEIFSGTDK